MCWATIHFTSIPSHWTFLISFYCSNLTQVWTCPVFTCHRYWLPYAYNLSIHVCQSLTFRLFKKKNPQHEYRFTKIVAKELASRKELKLIYGRIFVFGTAQTNITCTLCIYLLHFRRFNVGCTCEWMRSISVRFHTDIHSELLCCILGEQSETGTSKALQSYKTHVSTEVHFKSLGCQYSADELETSQLTKVDIYIRICIHICTLMCMIYLWLPGHACMIDRKLLDPLCTYMTMSVCVTPLTMG